MTNKHLYFEFTSQKYASTETELIKIEDFLKRYGLNFVFTIARVNKYFGRVSSGIKYETGGGYDSKRDEVTFIFSGYRGPKMEELKKEIEVLKFKNDNKALFEWLKQKKYIFCLNYYIEIQGPYGNDEYFNLSFRNDNDDNHKLNLYELNLLLTKIFKIYLVDDVFKISDNYKTHFYGTDESRNILYKKFLIKYLFNFPGRPYRLFDHDDKKNLLRMNNKDKTISKGLIIIPKKIYIKKVLNNKSVKNFVKTIQTLDSKLDTNSKKIYIDFLENKITKEEMKDLLYKTISDDYLYNDVIQRIFQAKQEKKQIENEILSKGRKKIPFNVFINKYINFYNVRNPVGKIDNKILKPSRSKNFLKKESFQISNILNISKFIKEFNIKFNEKMGDDITLEKIKKRINFTKEKALDILKELKEEDSRLSEEHNKYKKIKEEQYEIENEKISILMQELRKAGGKNTNEGKKIMDKIIEAQGKLYGALDKIEKEMDDIEDKIEIVKNVPYECDSLIENLFVKDKIDKYGYASLKKMIVDIYRSNLFNSKDIKRFLFEMKAINNIFEFYLFLS